MGKVSYDGDGRGGGGPRIGTVMASKRVEVIVWTQGWKTVKKRERFTTEKELAKESNKSSWKERI